MNILIVGPSWVGDMVMAQSLFICVQQQNPEATIDVLAPPWCVELLRRMPQVRHIHLMTLAHGVLGLGRRWALANTLKRYKYDQAIVLPNSFKSALIPLFAGIGIRTGWKGEARTLLLNDCRKLDKTRDPLMVQRFVALAYGAHAELPTPLPWPQLQVDASHTKALRDRLQLQDDKPILVLCPGAEFGPAKQWPQEYFAAVAAHYIHAGFQIWIMGSTRDTAFADGIKAQLEIQQLAHCSNLCGLTTLGDAVDLIAAASMVVSNDSGLMHVAAALALPLVVIYGSTSMSFTPPLAARVRTLSLQLPCSPCYQRNCPLGHLNCLKQMHPTQVINAVTELLKLK